MTFWSSLILAAIGLATQYFKGRAGRDSTSSIIAGALGNALTEIKQATAARQSVDDALRRHPDSVLRDDDGFRRD
jgi:hypothetical protein